MKNFRRICFGLVLSAAFTMPVWAGELQTPGAPAPGETQTPPAPGNTQGPGAMASGDTQGPSLTTSVILFIIQSRI
jgi:hypothetical protein